MINIKTIRDVIVSGLYNQVNIKSIPVNTDAPKPPYPYMTYNITSPMVEGVGREDETLISGTDYLTKKTEYEINMSMSLTAYSKDDIESYQTSLKAYEWFKTTGYDYLKANNIIVSDLSSIQNRDTVIEVDYERRNGFDITLRLTNVTEQDIEWIETVEIISNVKTTE